MSWPSRIATVAGRGAVRLVPAARRDWAEAVWAEAHEVPAGWPRLAWRAGGLGLIAKEGQMARTIGSWLLFAVAAGAAAWGAWPGPPVSHAAAVQGGILITLALLVGLPLLSRSVLGSPDNRAPGGSGPVSTPRSWPCCQPRPPSGCFSVRSRDQVMTGIPSMSSRARGAGQRIRRSGLGGRDRNPGLHGLLPGGPPGADRTSCAGGPGHAGYRRRAGLMLGLVMYAITPLGLNVKFPDRPWLHGSAGNTVGRWPGSCCSAHRCRRRPRGAALQCRGRPRSGSRCPSLAGLRRRGVLLLVHVTFDQHPAAGPAAQTERICRWSPSTYIDSVCLYR